MRAPRCSARFGTEVHGVLNEMLAFAESVSARADAPSPGDTVDASTAGLLRRLINATG